MTDNIVFLGVDPGLTGGLALIYPNKVEVIPMPVNDKELDVERILQFIPHLPTDWQIRAYVERVGAMPGNGVVSMFRFGFVTGVMHGAIRARRIPLELVAPQRWKKVVLADTDRSKEATVAWCRRVYPKTSLLATPRSKKDHQGMADALAIAHYGRMIWKG